jgi:hypothetical protein
MEMDNVRRRSKPGLIILLSYDELAIIARRIIIS